LSIDWATYLSGRQDNSQGSEATGLALRAGFATVARQLRPCLQGDIIYRQFSGLVPFRLRSIAARRLAQNAPLEHFVGLQPSLPTN
jgi:hypothetical protein